MSNERDELLDLHGPLLADIREQDDYAVSAVTSISAYSEGVEHALDTVWAKGYRKPRTIITREEVYALSDGAVVIDSAGDVSQLRDGFWFSYETSAMTPQRLAKYIPATVIYEGATK